MSSAASDVHLLRSPKNKRPAQLVDVLGFALGMLYEFDPQIALWVERRAPSRSMTERRWSFRFWLRYRDGREEYVLAVPAAQTEAAPNARRKHKLAKELLGAAEKLGMRLSFVFEAEIGARGGELATALRLLPYVLTARTLANRHTVRDRICEVVGSSPGIRLSELKAALEVFEPEDVQACTADFDSRRNGHDRPARPSSPRTSCSASACRMKALADLTVEEIATATAARGTLHRRRPCTRRIRSPLRRVEACARRLLYCARSEKNRC